MVENHTRDLLQLKAKETQLARSRNDAELTQAALSKAQRDIEALRASNSTSESSQRERELEMWRGRAERAESRAVEGEELDGNVLARLTDLEDFVAQLDGEVVDGDVVSRLSSRGRDLEDQNRRLLAQVDEYSTRITTLEDVSPHLPRPPTPGSIHSISLLSYRVINVIEFETSNDITISQWEKFNLLLSLIPRTVLCLRRRKREFLWST